MEIVKDVAAVIGVILSAISLITLLSKSARGFVSSLFRKYGKNDEMTEKIEEIRGMLEKHIRDESQMREDLIKMNEINLEFTRTQCRNLIKKMFYKYKDVKILPLYEKKTLMSIKELYVDKLKGNSFASMLISEMETWEIDYDSSYPEGEKE